jgi:hypothetical protein
MTDHAILRAKERYGLDLTRVDMAEISRLCEAGEGMFAETKVKGKVFILRYRDKVVIPLVSAFGAIITFYPHGQYAAVSRKQRSNRQRWNAKKKSPKKTRDRR